MSKWEFDNPTKDYAEIVTYLPKSNLSIVCNAELKIIMIDLDTKQGEVIVEKMRKRFNRILASKKYKETFNQDGWIQWTKKYSDIKDITSEAKVWNEVSQAYNAEDIPKENIEQIRNLFINSLNESTKSSKNTLSFIEFYQERINEALVFKDEKYKKTVMRNHTIVMLDSKGAVFRSSEFSKNSIKDIKKAQIDEYKKNGVTFHVLSENDFDLFKKYLEVDVLGESEDKTMVVSFLDNGKKYEGVISKEYVVGGQRVADIESEIRLHKAISLEDVEFEYYLKESEETKEDSLQEIIQELSLTKETNYFKGLKIETRDNGWEITTVEEVPKMLGFVKKGKDNRVTKKQVAVILLDNEAYFMENIPWEEDIVDRSHSYNHWLLKRNVNEGKDKSLLQILVKDLLVDEVGDLDKIENDLLKIKDLYRDHIKIMKSWEIIKPLEFDEFCRLLIEIEKKVSKFEYITIAEIDEVSIYLNKKDYDKRSTKYAHEIIFDDVTDDDRIVTFG